MNVYNRNRFLPKFHGIGRVEVSGQERVDQNVLEQGGGMLLLPNHPTHSDPLIFSEALYQIGLNSRTMAAYDVFLRSRLNAWVMQKMGVFSVDRDGSDRQSMAEAIRTLTETRDALTVFPEGNVYLQNDRLTPFMEGAAFMGLQAARKLSKHNLPMVAIPVAIKATYISDERPQIRERVAAMCEQLGIDPPSADHRIVECIREIGQAGLERNLRQRAIAVPDTGHLTLRETINLVANAVLEPLETKLEIAPKIGTTLIDRIRRARQKIHEVRTDPDRKLDHTVARTWADEAMLAFRIASYDGDYIHENPTLDRVAETVEKLEEDLQGEVGKPTGERLAMVRFMPPVDIVSHLGKGKMRDAAVAITDEVEKAVSKGLAELNEGNSAAGGQPW